MRSNIVHTLRIRREAAMCALLQRSISLLLSSSFMLTLMMTCASTPTLSQGSANIFSVFIKIQDQYTDASRVEITFYFSKNGSSVNLSKN